LLLLLLSCCGALNAATRRRRQGQQRRCQGCLELRLQLWMLLRQGRKVLAGNKQSSCGAATDSWRSKQALQEAAALHGECRFRVGGKECWVASIQSCKSLHQHEQRLRGRRLERERRLRSGACKKSLYCCHRQGRQFKAKVAVNSAHLLRLLASQQGLQLPQQAAQLLLRQLSRQLLSHGCRRRLQLLVPCRRRRRNVAALNLAPSRHLGRPLFMWRLLLLLLLRLPILLLLLRRLQLINLHRFVGGLLPGWRRRGRRVEPSAAGILGCQLSQQLVVYVRCLERVMQPRNCTAICPPQQGHGLLTIAPQASPQGLQAYASAL
jgi:hypothetical protein